MNNFIEKKLKDFDRIFITENMWKSDDEYTANVPVDNIKKFVASSLLEQQEQIPDKIIKEIQNMLSKGYEPQNIIGHLCNRFVLEDIIKDTNL